MLLVLLFKTLVGVVGACCCGGGGEEAALLLLLFNTPLSPPGESVDETIDSPTPLLSAGVITLSFCRTWQRFELPSVGLRKINKINSTDGI